MGSSDRALRERMLTNTPYRLRHSPLRKFHATRIYSGKLQASVRLELPKAKVKATPSRPSQLRDKKATVWKRNEGKRSRNESFPTFTRLSSLLRRHDQKTQHQHAAGGESTPSKSLGLAKSKGKLSSRSASTKWIVHPRTSENDTTGGSPYFSNLCLSIGCPEQPISDKDEENSLHLPNSLSYWRRVDGVIQPRVDLGSILQGRH
jgi:hypothetical protein